MPTYQVSFLDSDNHICLPAEDVVAPNDQDAIVKAREFIDSKDIELWDGPRFIVRLPHK